MIRIYHNPRCRKSREALEFIRESGQSHEVVEYLKEPLSISELQGLLAKLQMEPIELVRRGEAIWKEKYRGKDLSSSDVLKAMATYPKLIERPIAVKGEKAVVGRPPENVKVLWNEGLSSI